MGGSKDFLESGGFSKYEYKTVGVTHGGIKIIEKVAGGSAALPGRSNTPGTVYAVLRADGTPKQIMVYGNDRIQQKRIDLDHDHPPQKGFHVQYFDGRKTSHTLSSEEKRMIKDLYDSLRRKAI